MADNIQHGIDDDSSGDAAKGAALGGLGGAAVGAAAGSLIGPVGTVIGAAVGAISGAVGSGAAVAAVDAVDNDDTVSGVGGGTSGGSTMSGTGEGGGHNIVTGEEAETDAGKGGLATGALAGGALGAAVGGPVGAVVGGVAGSLAGGVAGDASEAADDMRGTTGGTGSYGSSTPNMQSGTATGGVVSTGPLSDEMGAVAGGGLNVIGGMASGSAQETDRDVMRVPVVEEELHVEKEMREAGEVQVHKRVVEEQVNVPVTVQREEVVVTRHDVDRPVSSTEISGDVLQDGETIRVPVREEVAVVSKEAHVVEEVEIAKTRVAEQQTVSDTVRREEVDIDDSTRTGGTSGGNSVI
ncbi:MAG: YsnF/AvaK domain-containing protein [Armatimonadetes bacterium]|nr:YsnF/AvaK domain-containing protein [Armatimonadota bacterium]